MRKITIQGPASLTYRLLFNIAGVSALSCVSLCANAVDTYTANSVVSASRTTNGIRVSSPSSPVLTINNGAVYNVNGAAAADGTSVAVGMATGQHGALHISGAGTSLTTTNAINIGSNVTGQTGTGELLIADGAHVSTVSFIMRYASTTTVTGAGSTLNADTLVAGSGAGTGRAKFYLLNGGSVVAQTGGLVVRNADFYIGDGSASSGSETITAPRILLMPDANLIFRQTDAGYTSGVRISSAGAGTAGKVIIESGAITLSGNNDYFGDTNILQGSLAAAGTGAFSHNSTFNLNGGTQLYLQGLEQSLGGLNNSGSVYLQQQGSKQVGNLLTVNGTYTSNGGSIYLNSQLNGDNSLTDRLVLNEALSATSDPALSATQLYVNNVGGIGAQTVEGIKLIDVAGASTAQFNLVGSYTHEGSPAVVSGAYAYKLYQGSTSDPADGDWYLRSHLDSSAPSPKPLFQAGVPVYEAYAQSLLGLNSLPTLRQRVGNRTWSNQLDTSSLSRANDEQVKGQQITLANGVWAKVEGGSLNTESRSSTTQSDYDQDVTKAQIGVDWLVNEAHSSKLMAGLTAHYVKGRSKVDSPHGDGTLETDGYGVGANLTWYSDNGLYVDGQAQATWYRTDLKSSLVGPSLKSNNDGFGYAVSVESGKRIPLTPEWSLTPQAQLTYSEVDYDNFTDVFNTRVNLDRGESLQGRVGLSLDRETSWLNSNGKVDRTHVYAVTNLYNEFLDGTRTNVADTTVKNKRDRLEGGLGLGGTYSWDDGKYSIFGEGLTTTSLENFGDSYSLVGQVGVRVRF